jgi:uncharacterized membrane protein HdeD (DUF308 family)
MITAITLIILGLLILFFPTLLSIIVGLLLVAAGIAVGLVAFEYRRTGSMRSTRVIRIILDN